MMRLSFVLCIALSLIEIDCEKHGANPPATGKAPDLTSTRGARVVPVSDSNQHGKYAAPIRISVRLIDGSQLIGIPNSTLLPLRSPYGVVDVQLEQVTSMTMKDTSGSVRIEFRNGDILQGNLQNESLSLETLLGTVSIPFARVTTFHVLNPTDSIADGLVAYYPLDGTTEDFSGHGHNAVNHGAVPGTDRFGSPGKALAFGGSGEYVALPEGLINPEASEFTLSLWLLTRTLEGYHTALYFGAKSAEAAVHMRDGKFRVGPALVDGRDHSVSAPASQDAYTHLACVYRRGKMLQLWIDGRLSEEKILPNLPLVSGRAEYASAIGWYAPEHPEHAQRFGVQSWHGSIDDIRIYNRALTEDEIRLLALDR
jgi:hypothetical protein